MQKVKICHRCKRQTPIEKFVDTSGTRNQMGHYCESCHLERGREWRQAALAEETSHIPKLKIVYGKYWRHYAEPEDFYTTLQNERDFCPYCGTKFDRVTPTSFNEAQRHLDHMDPLHIGGEHSIRNVVLCCGPCNIKKGKLSFQKWLEKLKPKFQKIAKDIYRKKHGHAPEKFKEGDNFGRGSREMEFAICFTEEELRRKYPNPIVNAPPSNKFS